MSRLETLRAERDMIEGRDDWANPALGYLNDTIEALEAEERAKAPTPTATELADDPVRALQAEMEAALAHPERFSDVQRDDLVRRYNALGQDAAWRAEGEATSEEAARVRREMLVAEADPSKLTDEQAADLVSRYNRVARGHQPVPSADSPDLAERMEAAVQAQERGEDVDVDGLMAQFQTWQEQQLAAARDPANFPPELQEAARVMFQAEDAQGRPADPVDAAIGDFNAWIRRQRPPSVEEQLAALGIQAEPAGEGQGDG